jgi:protein-L-isoaspartate(D-aspartate) O-methyltransferase
MIEEQLHARGVADSRVIAAMEQIPREKFVPAQKVPAAYSESPLQIGYDQTISAPFIVGLMTQLAHPHANSRALDIGTGSGYQAAVLGKLCQEVYSIEIVKPLAEAAKRRLKSLGYKNITVRWGDGYQGWKEHAPFDLIVVAAAPDHVPQPLIDQLASGGRLVIPVGDHYQELIVLEKHSDGKPHRDVIRPVKFVPMTGKARQARP